MFVIEKAVISQAKARLAIVGPAGCGKTYTALVTAKELGDKILVIDTENGSSSKYADKFSFDILRLPDYSLKTYIDALDYVSGQDYDVVIVDSLSHAWAGPGGALEQVDNTPGKNKFTSGWRVVTPVYNKLVEKITSFPKHLIATMRMKMQYILVTNDKGLQEPQKAGMGIVQRDGIEYEFDILAEMTVDHILHITKTRCFTLDGFIEEKPGPLLGQHIRAWLTEGVEPPQWPDGWHPTKKGFFDKAADVFGWSFDEIATQLRQAQFAGYNPEMAADMWRAIEKVHNSLVDNEMDDIEIEVDKEE